MTVVRWGYKAPADGALVAAPRTISFTLGKIVTVYPDTDLPYTIVPGDDGPILVTAGPDGRGEVDLPPLPISSAYIVDVFRGGLWYIQPPASGPVNLEDLPHIDPTTLEPTAAPEAAWWAAIDDQIDGAELRDDYHLVLKRRDGEELDLGYVRGAQGAIGPAGPIGMVFRGAWDAFVDYANLDAVVYSGTTWFATGNPPVGAIPGIGSAYWSPMAVQGSQGNPGPANSLTIGNVTTIQEGGVATAAIRGTSPNQILDLGLVQGYTGEKGDPGDLTESSPINFGGAAAWSLSGPSTIRITPTAAITFSALSGGPAGYAYTVTLIILQGATPYAISWPSNVRWSEGIVPVVPLVANSRHAYNLFWDGAVWSGQVMGVNYA